MHPRCAKIVLPLAKGELEGVGTPCGPPLKGDGRSNTCTTVPHALIATAQRENIFRTEDQVIRTVLFDMGNVLVHFCHDRMCDQIGALCGRSGPEVRNLLIDSGLQWEFERGQVSEEGFRARLEEATGSRLDLDEVRQAGSDIFTLNEPIVPLLDALRRRNHRLVLLSNTSISHFEFVSREFDVLSRFDDYVTSYGVGAVKPEPAIYEAAKQAINCAPEECFYTDDIPEYVHAAREHGFEAEVFIGVPQLKAHLQDRGVSIE